MGTASDDALAVAAIRSRTALVAGATRLERAAIPHLPALAGRAPERAAAFRPFAAVEGVPATGAPPFAFTSLGPTVASAGHVSSTWSAKRCDREGALRQRCGSSTCVRD